MKLAGYAFIVLACCSVAFAQKKGTLPPPEKTLPGKDPVVAISTIDAGKSRNYNCKGAKVTFGISSDGSAGTETVAIHYNGKAVSGKCKLTGKAFTKTLGLQKDANILVLSPAAGTAKESFNAKITVQDAAIKYAITASLKKGLNDTIILKKR